jgi:hypothetical protein
MGDMRSEYTVLFGKSEGKRSLGRPRRRWENNIKVDLRRIGSEDVDWVELVENSDYVKGREFLHQLSDNQHLKKDSVPKKSSPTYIAAKFTYSSLTIVKR